MIIISTGPEHSKFESWTSENANYKKNYFFLNLKSFLCVYTTFFFALCQVFLELVYIKHFLYLYGKVFPVKI